MEEPGRCGTDAMREQGNITFLRFWAGFYYQGKLAIEILGEAKRAIQGEAERAIQGEAERASKLYIRTFPEFYDYRAK